MGLVYICANEIPRSIRKVKKNTEVKGSRIYQIWKRTRRDHHRGRSATSLSLLHHITDPLTWPAVAVWPLSSSLTNGFPTVVSFRYILSPSMLLIPWSQKCATPFSRFWISILSAGRWRSLSIFIPPTRFSCLQPASETIPGQRTPQLHMPSDIGSL